jgi:hypothetical protein
MNRKQMANQCNQCIINASSMHHQSIDNTVMDWVWIGDVLVMHC